MSDNKDIVLSLDAGVSLCAGEGRTHSDLLQGEEEPLRTRSPSQDIPSLFWCMSPFQLRGSRAFRMLGPEVCGYHHDLMWWCTTDEVFLLAIRAPVQRGTHPT